MESISICKIEEIAGIKKFIHDEWKKNHILSENQTLLNFQHKQTDGYNFVISKNEEGKITGILGFIPTSQYDIDLKLSDIWLAIWKIDTKNSQPGIGFMLLKWLEKKIKPQSIGSIGINLEVKKIYVALAYRTGILKHYYILNPNIKEYKIAIPSKIEPEFKSSENETNIKEVTLEEISHIQSSTYPRKSIAYLENRYIKHPYYKYELYGAYNKDSIEAVFIIRKIEVQNSSCFRIVDIFGELKNLSSLKNSFIELLINNNSEYIDCLNHGVPQEIFEKLGFNLRTQGIIIPNYFEPFVRENTDVHFAFKTQQTNYIIYKGDSDQDRPNLINY